MKNIGKNWQEGFIRRENERERDTHCALELSKEF
jgi:hypothetical protein